MFDDYIEQRLSGQELENFKKLLNEDHNLFEELQLHKDLIVGIQQQGRMEKKEYFRRLEEQIRQEELVERAHKEQQKAKLKTLFNPLVGGIAASLIIGILTYLIFTRSTEIDKPKSSDINAAPSTENLFAEYFKPYENMVHPSKRGTEITIGEEELAFEAYDQKKYDVAIDKLKTVLLDEGDEVNLFYLANAYLASEKTDEAIYILERLKMRCNILCIQEKWYLALSYLKKKEYNKAIPLLKELKDSKGSYARKSYDILSRLK